MALIHIHDVDIRCSKSKPKVFRVYWREAPSKEYLGYLKEKEFNDFNKALKFYNKKKAKQK